MTAMVSSNTDNRRVLAGMRTTGRIHLGNYFGALKNWVKLQYEYDCYFFAADWHALTTHYDNTSDLELRTWEMIEDWLAAGLDPGACKIFIQSGVPEHAELHLLLSMITPLSWLERVPTYKDQQEKLKDLDLATYGFLGYPLLQSADILLYKPRYVPVGEDQVVHVELTREVARRFNHIFGKEPDFEERAEAAIQKMGKKNAKLFRNFLKQFQEQGDGQAVEKGQALLNSQSNLSLTDKERLLGFLEGSGRIILPEPDVLLTEVPKFPGLDGQKMSKSYNNTIELTEEPKSVETKIRTMPTDPARVRRTDPGDPAKCPVWSFHKIFSDEEQQNWVQEGCTTAGIGCIDCKAVLWEHIIEEQKPIIERAEQFKRNPAVVRGIVQEGIEEARDLARTTMDEVRSAMGISQR